MPICINGKCAGIPPSKFWNCSTSHLFCMADKIHGRSQCVYTLCGENGKGKGKHCGMFSAMQREAIPGNENGLFVFTKLIILILLLVMQNGSKVYFRPILLVTNRIQQLKCFQRVSLLKHASFS